MTSKKRLSPTKRHNLALTEDTQQKIRDIILTMGAANTEEAVRRAINLYHMMIRIDEKDEIFVRKGLNGHPLRLRFVIT